MADEVKIRLTGNHQCKDCYDDFSTANKLKEHEKNYCAFRKVLCSKCNVTIQFI